MCNCNKITSDFTPITYEQNQKALGNSTGTTYVMTRSEKKARDRELKREREYNIDMEAAKQGVVKGNIFDLIGGLTAKLGEQQAVTPKNTFAANTTTPKAEPEKDNTMLYIGGLLVLVAVIYFVTQNN